MAKKTRIKTRKTRPNKTKSKSKVKVAGYHVKAHTRKSRSKR